MVQVVIPCCEADQDQAERLIRWIAELGQVNTKGHLHCSKDCKVDYLMALMQEAFVETKWIQDVENIKSNWREPGHHHKSAAGPNSLFRQVAWYFNLRDRRPWLFLEPDAIPCRKDWYEKLDQEYREGKKPFLGAKVLSTTPGSDIPTHMTGVAIYHPDTPAVSNMAVVHNETPFDITGAADFMPQAKFTTSIVHHFRRGDFLSQEDFESRVPEGTCLYHTCKTGSIIPYLRARLGLKNTGLVQLEERPSPKRNVEGSNPSPRAITANSPVCDIYIKTWKRDWPMLEMCLGSIIKYGRGFRRVIVESEERPNIIGDFVWVKSVDVQPGYLWQQACKLNAASHTDAEYILYLDSDCAITRDISPQDFIHNGKPIWQYTPFANARDDQSVWIGPMERFVGKRPEHEFMRRHPFFVPRWALYEIEKFCFYKHGQLLPSYIMHQADSGNGLALTFSEWNCLGFFLHEFHHDKIHWVLDSEAGPACVFQGFTHGGEERFSSDLRKMTEIVQGAVITLPEPEKPVASLTEQLRGHVEALKALVEPSKVGRTQMLHEELRKAGLLGPAQKRERKVRNEEKKYSLLLLIHTYPRGNETLKRHWNSFSESGADYINIVTTEDDGDWTTPIWNGGHVIKIGANKYIDGDHLVQRLIETIEYALTTQYTHFCICEYDVVFLDKIPKFSGCCAHSTGGKLPGSKASRFHHNPWLLDRETAEKLLPVMKELAPSCTELPDNSPDVFFGYATEKAGIEVKEIMKQFTRNTIEPHDIGDMMKAVQDGVQVIHGIKDEQTLACVVSVA